MFHIQVSNMNRKILITHGIDFKPIFFTKIYCFFIENIIQQSSENLLEQNWS